MNLHQNLSIKCIGYSFSIVSRKTRGVLVFVRVYRKESEKETLKSAMYVTEIEHLDFLQAYLAGLSITLAT